MSLKVYLTILFTIAGIIWGNLAQARTVYTYANTTASTTNEISRANFRCSNNIYFTRTFVVTDSFTVSEIALGLNMSHADRNDLRIRLQAPSGAVLTLEDSASSGTTFADVDVNFNAQDDAGPNDVFEDGDTDPVAWPYYSRMAYVPGMNFYSGNASGTWTLQICDDEASNDGTFHRAQLSLISTASPTTSVCKSTLSYDWGSNGNLVPFTSTTLGGVTLTMIATTGEAINDDPQWTSYITNTGMTGTHTGYFMTRMDISGDAELSGESPTFQFSVPVRDFAFSALDVDWGSWEDFVNLYPYAGTSQTAPRVPYTTVIYSATGYSGDIVESDSGASSTQNFGNVDYYFPSAMQTVKFEWNSGDDFPTNPNYQFVGLSDFSFCAFDYGDAPNSYGTLLASNGARHVLGDRNLYLGAAQPLGEVDALSSATATLDGSEEDGVATFLTYISTGGMSCSGYTTLAGEYCVVVTLRNNQAVDASLVGFIDFNGDGDFADAGERSIPRLGGFTTGPQGDNSYATGNILASSGTQTRVLVWSGFTTRPTVQATYARIRLSSDPVMFGVAPPFNGMALDGEAEDYRLGAGTLPVTLAFVESVASNGQVDVSWITATETQNFGFEILTQSNGDYSAVSGIILSKRMNSGETSSYTTKLTKALTNNQFWIADIDIAGKRTKHGPFNVGENIGSKPGLVPVRNDTPAQRAAPRQIANRQGARLEITERGFHRVTHQDLLNAGVDLSGIAVSDLAVSHKGLLVERRIYPENGTFGPNSYIDFFATPLPTLYNKQSAYFLEVIKDSGVIIKSNNAAPGPSRGEWYMAQTRFAPDIEYTFGAPGNDPWYADTLVAFAGSPANKQFSLDSNNAARGVQAVNQLDVSLFGGTSWPGGDLDHRANIFANGQLLATMQADGIVEMNSNLELSQSAVYGGSVQIDITATGDTGYAHDVIHLNSLELRYPRLPVAEQNRLFADNVNFSAPAENAISETPPGPRLDSIFDSGIEEGEESRIQPGSIRASGFDSNQVIAYQRVDDTWNHLTDIRVLNQNGSFTVFAASPELKGSYWISTTAAMHKAAVKPLYLPSALPSGDINYLVISHGDFIEAIEPLSAHRRSKGLLVANVNVGDIYDAYSEGLAEPKAIQAFISDVIKTKNLQYVLLVGGDTFDYKNHLNLGAKSFIPTLYTATGEVMRYTPVDPSFVDFDNDKVPDISIGRLPVRSVTELNTLINKIISYESGNTNINAIQVAGGGGVNRAFSEIADDYVAQQTGRTVDKAYSDVIGVAATRQSLLNGLNAGSPLITFIGHSAPSQWTFDPILRTADIASLTNLNAPTVAIQWGCWNSYYVSATGNTMAHALLLSGQQGAAAVFGAVALSDVSSHEKLGVLLAAQLRSGQRIGDAILAAKRQLAITEPGHDDVQLGTTLLGDPAMTLR